MTDYKVLVQELPDDGGNPLTVVVSEVKGAVTVEEVIWRFAQGHLSGPGAETLPVGAPPATPLLCFACVTATCQHAPCPGVIPAVTCSGGTALCLDCACVTVYGPRES